VKRISVGTRTELVWPGKYAEDGRRKEAPQMPVPLEVAEAYGGDSQPEVPGSGWRNRLIHGDNLAALQSLQEDLGGKIDLMYMDPPFATGSDFLVAMEIGESDLRGIRSRRNPPAAEMAYRDSWGRDLGPYLDMIYARLLAVRPLLAPNGTVFVHVDRRVAHHVKFILDEVFGEERLINEIIWCYTGPSSPGMKSFANKHDVIFWYGNGPSWTFNVDRVRLPYNPSTKRNEGRRTGFTTGNPDLVVTLNALGKFPEDWWTIPVEAPASSLRTSYPTQKPERLLKRILLAASSEGALVADFFCGSGTTLAVAEKLGRRWVGCDASRFAIQTTRKRLLGIDGHRAFDVLRPENFSEGDRPGSVPEVDVRLERTRKDGKLVVRATLSGFSFPRPEEIPAPVRSKVKRWSDYIDSWSVDWNHSDGVFRPGFLAQRTRKRRKLLLTSDAHIYEKSGEHPIAAKVVDIFGNETVVRPRV
jgi:DNA modification methylase